jgi:dye decolorizing peroxidase
LKAFGAVVVTVGTGALLHLLLTAADRADGYVGAFFSGNLLQLLFVAVAVGGGVLLLRGKPAAAWIAGPGAAALGLHAVGYEIPVLWRSSAPFAGPIGLDRALAVLVPGLGVGVAVALVFMIRRSPVVLEEKVEEEPMFGRTKDSPVSRRRFIGATSAAGVGGLAVGGGAVALLSGSGDSDEAAALSLKHLGSATVPFHGDRQGGVVNPAQANTVFLAFDLEPGADKAKTAALMRRWSDAAARMSRGEVPDLDDQIATDSGPSSLTVTFGFGGSLFEKVGLADRRPAGLRDLPAFPGDAIDPARSGGDLSVQVCADDGLVTFHAVRVLQRLAKGTARVRWQMSGFSRTPGTETRPVTTRNLMGQVDGTGNPAVTEPDFDKKIFVAEGDGQPWLRGGTYVVMRRIRMLLDDWDGQDLAHQEKVIGRRKSDGGPLSGGPERTPIDYGARGPDGSLAIADNAHVRVSAPEFNRGATMLRRGYSYHDGFDATGVPDAGLLFIAYQHDPHEVFVPVQQKLARGDALSKFIRHESSAVFVVPPGCKPGGYVGQQLLEA